MKEETRVTNAVSPAVAKWRNAISPEGRDKGFMVVPDLLLRRQKDLGISPQEMIVLLNIIMHWWKEDSLPFPSATRIAQRLQMSPRSVERHIKSLCDKGYLKKLRPEELNGKEIRRFDLSGLIEKLESMQ